MHDAAGKKKVVISRKGARIIAVRSANRTPLAMCQLAQYKKTMGKSVEHGISLQWPMNRSSFWLSSFFGPRKKHNRIREFHYGLDMAAVKGVEVEAAATGMVVEAGYCLGYGNTVVIMHSNKYRTRYAHLDLVAVARGQYVQTGQRIGTVGDTGNVRKRGSHSSSHLHFEVCAYGKKVNPLYFFS